MERIVSTGNIEIFREGNILVFKSTLQMSNIRLVFGNCEEIRILGNNANIFGFEMSENISNKINNEDIIIIYVDDVMIDVLRESLLGRFSTIKNSH